MENKKKGKRSGLPNYEHLIPDLASAVIITLFIGVVLFVFLKDQFYDPASNTSLYDIMQTTVVAMGALTVGGAAIIQYRKHKMLEVQAACEEEQAVLDLEDRFTERFTKAIEHLGNENLHIRIGAIYELKLLAMNWDDEEARKSIVEILTAFIRDGIEEFSAAEDEEPRGKQPKPENDVFIACTVLSALRDEFTVYIDLNLLNAIDVDLSRINLHKAKLMGAHLQEANLEGANLEWANLEWANLEWANLEEAHLKWANLRGANLEEAHLKWANLRGANLEEAHLEGADLEGAYLEFAHLEGADLSLADLNARQLLYAFVDNTTILDDDIRAEYEALIAAESED